jgi:hypothetical protein
VKLFIGERKLDEMIVEMLDDRYPVIRIGWQKENEGFGVGKTYEQFYLKFEFKELKEDGSLHYKMNDIEGIEVEPADDYEDWFVHENFLDGGI